MKTKIYVGDDYRLLDMFDDEPIQITSKLSDIEKLSNVFNDYSNSFSVPATPNNSAIFKHYYDWDIDNGFNANIVVNGYIEIDTIPFKFGKIQLEDVVLKGHRPSTYKITFFGALRQLSDIFGDDTINRLDYVRNPDGTETKEFSSLSQFEYEYTGTNFLNTINNPTFMDGNVMTPLIAYANRDWNYGTGDSTDISGGPESAGAILDTELRPALRIAKILEGIETKYDISFSRDFFGKAVFNNLFLWCDPSLKSFGNYNTLNIQATEYELEEATANGFDVDNATDTFSYESVTGDRSITLYIVPNAGFEEINYTIAIYDSGVQIFESEVFQGINNVNFVKNGIHNLTYKIKADGNFQYFFTFILLAPDWTNYIQINNQPSTIPIDGFDAIWKLCQGGINFADLLPKMKVVDFVQGIMKMFKLMIRPISETQFYVDTLDGYYSRGSALNITEYVDNTNVLIERPLIYKTIKFLYQKTENVLGKRFRQLNDPRTDEIGYGDLLSLYSSIKNTDELKIQLPFENMLFERLTIASIGPNKLTNIIIGQSCRLETDNTLTANNSKPILFFNNGIANTPDFPFKVNFEGEIDTVSYPYIIGNTNDARLSQVTDTINFGSEIDPWHLSQVENSLYFNYWESWINTIYSLRQRKLTYTANLPTRFVQELSLNNRLLIGDSRFKINDFTVDIPTGKTKLTLFNDIFSYAEPRPVVAMTEIEATAGTKYYGIPLNTEAAWYVELIDLGYGTSWVEVLTPSGTGSSEITIRILEKASQLPPEVYDGRTLTMNIWVSGTAYAILVTQEGLVEP